MQVINYTGLAVDTFFYVTIFYKFKKQNFYCSISVFKKSINLTFLIQFHLFVTKFITPKMENFKSSILTLAQYESTSTQVEDHTVSQADQNGYMNNRPSSPIDLISARNDTPPLKLTFCPCIPFSIESIQHHTKLHQSDKN